MLKISISITSPKPSATARSTALTGVETAAAHFLQFTLTVTQGKVSGYFRRKNAFSGFVFRAVVLKTNQKLFEGENSQKMNRREAINSILTAGTLLAASGAEVFAQTETKGATVKFTEYTPKTFNLDGLAGLNKDMLDEHYGLYKGYVTNTNKLQTALAQMLAENKADTPEYAETRRRLGFEYDGIRLHEYYFGAMKPQGSAVPDKFKNAVAKFWGSFDAWQADFVRTGLMRGIGWAILYRDPLTGGLQNFWISDHEYGHPAGFQPILVMDVWEHAYIKQYGASGRKAYVEAFFKNLDWTIVNKQLG
jgi:Fe-Mn family superoxide dismutase